MPGRPQSMVGRSARAGGRSDFDGFRLDLAPGTLLTGVAISMGAAVGPGVFDFVRWSLGSQPFETDPGYQSFATLNLAVPTAGAVSFTTGLPRPPGSLVLASRNVGGSVTNTEAPIASYEIRLTVAQVPTPATLPLMAGALGILAWQRRRPANRASTR